MRHVFMLGVLLVLGCKRQQTLPTVDGAALSADHIDVALPLLKLGECRFEEGPQEGKWKLVPPMGKMINGAPIPFTLFPREAALVCSDGLNYFVRVAKWGADGPTDPTGPIGPPGDPTGTPGTLGPTGPSAQPGPIGVDR